MSPASSCHDLYLNHNVFVSGQYVVDAGSGQTVTVSCDIEGKVM